LAVAFNLFIAILMSAKVSGGMCNPAVAISCFITNGKFFSEIGLLLMIILSQVIGAYCGIIYAHFVVGAPAMLCPFD
jgi:glycerol uptake facilitator-like aquaporin